MHADERAALSIGQRLGVDDPDEQRADEPRARGHGHRVHRREGQSRLGERAVHDRRQGGQVRAARQLGDDTAEYLMHVLRQNGEARQLALHEDGRRGFIARRLDAEDDLSHDESGAGA